MSLPFLPDGIRVDSQRATKTWKAKKARNAASAGQGETPALGPYFTANNVPGNAVAASEAHAPRDPKNPADAKEFDRIVEDMPA
jgi:hypothetical protein